jgi:hypothetical protein
MQTFTKIKRTYLEHTGSKLSYYEDQLTNKTLQKIEIVSLDELYWLDKTSRNFSNNFSKKYEK